MIRMLFRAFCGKNRFRILYALLIFCLLNNRSYSASWKFIVYGDTRSDDARHREVLRSMVNNTPDYKFIINVGDVVGDGRISEKWDIWKAACDSILGGTGQNSVPPKYMACPGNHDMLNYSEGLNNWNQYLPGQYQEYGNYGKFFVFDYKNARFIILDSEFSYKKGGQYSMLLNAIDSNTKTWLFAFWHRPVFDFDAKRYEDEIHDTWGVPLYKRGCDIIFTGHAHYYLRTKKLELNGEKNPPLDPENGTVQIVAGNGGAPLHSVNPNKDGNGYMLESYKEDYGYCEITIDGDQLYLKHYLRDGTVTDQVTLTANFKGCPDIDVLPSMYDYGDILIGEYSSKTFSITNEGSDVLNVISTEITGTNSSDFNFTSGSGSFAIKPDSTHDIVIRFSPSSLGNRSATFTIESDDPDENPFEVELKGRGVAPDIDVDPDSKDFGNVIIGESSSQKFTVKNMGNLTLVVNSTSITGPNSNNFSIDNEVDSFTLDQGESLKIEVSFIPTSSGSKNGVLKFENNDPDENPKEIYLTGIGVIQDDDSPAIRWCYPPSGAQWVAKNTSIEFSIIDSTTGVNRDSIKISVNGEEIVRNGIVQNGFDVTVTPNNNRYKIKYRPSESFDQNSSVTVNVKAVDLSVNENSIDTTYCFRTGEATVEITSNKKIGASGGTILDDSLDIEIIISPGSLVDTTEISIGRADKMPVLPDTVSGIGTIFYLSPDGIRFLIPVTLRIPYTQEDLDEAGVSDPSKIPIYMFSTVNGRWSNLMPAGYDEDLIYVEISEFCYITLGKYMNVENRVGEIKSLYGYLLMQNYPNPFNSETTISYTIKEKASVRIDIFDTSGRKIRTLIDEEKEPGLYAEVWNGCDDEGRSVGSGLYIYVMKCRGRTKIKKALLLR